VFRFAKKNWFAREKEKKANDKIQKQLNANQNATKENNSKENVKGYE
jgi:hypothetical protein